MNAYSITIKGHLKALTFHIIGTSLMLTTLIYFEYDSTMVKVFGCFWFALTVPTLSLHIEYFLKDRFKEVLVEKKRMIVNEKNQIIIDKKFEEVTSVIISCSKNIKDFGIPQFPIESYYYLTFQFRDGGLFVCTSLIFSDFNKIRKIFAGIPITFKYSLYNDL